MNFCNSTLNCYGFSLIYWFIIVLGSMVLISLGILVGMDLELILGVFLVAVCGVRPVARLGIFRLSSQWFSQIPCSLMSCDTPCFDRFLEYPARIPLCRFN
jgi:hypothetical protein